MKQLLRKILLAIMPAKVKGIINHELVLEMMKMEQQAKCYAQEGEDLILAEFFHGVQKGFFIDIGSYHPILFSNTYLFYQKGWRGINIDARPQSMEIFNKIRPEDINIEVAIGKEEKTLTYYMFDEPGLNGFSKEISEDRDANTEYKIQRKVDLPLRRLENVLEQYLPVGTKISFMSIDVEGLDMEVLESNNWSKYRPEMILVETSVMYEGNAFQSDIHLFLVDKGYQFAARTVRTSFYKLMA